MLAAVQFAGMVIVILLSIAFALFVEWVSLWGLLKMMPATRREPVPERVVPIHTRRSRLHAAGR
jgi:hypothetical protein